jgi:hypothetical protein
MHGTDQLRPTSQHQHPALQASPERTKANSKPMTHILPPSLPHPPDRHLLQPAHEPRIVSVHFILALLAREVDLRGVGY